MMGRRLRTVAAATGILLVVGLTVAGLSRVRLETSLDSFLPTHDAALTSYDQVSGEFGADPIVVLLETSDASYLSGDRLADTFQLEGSLATLDDVASVYGPATLLNQIAGRAQDLLSELLGRRDAEIARARAQAAAAGGDAAAQRRAAVQARNEFDGRYGPLLVRGMPGGMPTLKNQQFVNNVVFGSAGRPRGQWRFVVPTAQSVAIIVRPKADLSADQTSALTRAVRRIVDLRKPDGVQTTVTGSPVLVAAMSQATRSDAVRLGVLAICAVGLCLLAATFVRRSRRLAPLAITLMAVAAALAVVGWADRPVSLGVVAFCSVLLGIGCYYPTYFTLGAEPRTVLVVAAATAASLATLTLSPLPLVRDLGFTMALGVVFAAVLAWSLRGWLARGGVEGPVREPAVVSPRSRTLARAGCGVLVLVAVLGWVWLPGLDVETDVEHFAGGLSALDDAQHAEDVIGSSGEVDIVLRGPDAVSPQTLAWGRRALDAVVQAHGDQMRPVLSPAQLFGFLGTGQVSREQVDAGFRLLPDYLTRAVATEDRSTAVMTFGVSIDDLGELRSTIADVRRELPPPPAGYDVEVTGLPLVLIRGEQLVSADRIGANLWGVAAAGVVLLIGLRRRDDALRAIGAAVLATGAGFFVAHVAGFALNPVTVALGALTAAVGCEFTVVQAEAVRTGSRRLRRAVGLVAATSAVGYLVLLGSSMAAVRSFGLLLAGSVGLAALASWVVVTATVRTPTAPPPAPAVREPELVHV